MIVELRVRDLATIEDITLPLGPGLNVLTGETGAGKSILVDAIALLLGARGDPGAVRDGTRRLVVEGVFEGPNPALAVRMDELGLDSDSESLVLRREVSSEGRSRGWVNGSPVTMTSLASLGEFLVDLHGQHETHTLLEPDRQREVLDTFGDALPEAAAVATLAAEESALERAESELVARRDEVRRRADYLRHLCQEIETARLAPGEDEALDTEARRLSQAGTLSDLANRIADLVGGDDAAALTAMATADKALAALERADPGVANWHELLDPAFAQLQELARVAAAYAADLEEDPGRLAEIERRRDLIYRLKQKYGETISAVLETGRVAGAELEVLDTAELDLRLIARRRETAQAALVAGARALSDKREAAAGRLGRSVTKLLASLGMADGQVAVELSPREQPTPSGAETVAFTARLNRGLEARPLGRSASGGELSRIMLAVKTVLGRHDQIPTQVFDEVDHGVGGEIGAQVADLLEQVAERRQVLVITHLAPIAARADRHIAISKQPRRGVATSDIQVLRGEDRIGEVARMLGDAEGETARRHAVTLLGDARRVDQGKRK